MCFFVYFFEGEEKCANYTCTVCWDDMAYIRYMKWQGRKSSSLANFQEVQVLSKKSSKRWTFKKLPSNQNRLVKAESHPTGLSGWHSFQEVYEALHAKIFRHRVDSWRCKSSYVGRNGVLLYICQMLGHLLHLKDCCD